MRRATTAFILIVGWAAVVATSPPSSSIDAVGTSEGMVLVSQGSPEARIPFSFSATEDALRGEVAVEATLSYLWLEDAAPIQVVWETPFGRVEDDQGPMTCDERCLGDSALVIRWPFERDGGALVSWSLVAGAHFDVGIPPEGGELTLDVGSLPDLSGQVERVTVGDPGDPIHHASVEVDEMGPDVERLVLALSDNGYPAPVEYRVETSTGTHFLRRDESVTLDRDDCEGPVCRFEILSDGGGGGPAIVALPSGSFEVSVDDLGIPPTSVDGGSIPLRSEGDDIEILLKLPWNEAYLSYPEPVLVIEASRLDGELTDRGLSITSSLDTGRWRGGDGSADPLLVDLECQAPASCSGAFTVEGPSEEPLDVILTLKGSLYHPGLSGSDTVEMEVEILAP